MSKKWKITRRRFLAAASATVAALATGARPLRRAFAGEELRLITWEGYAADPIIEGFVKETGATVARTYITSNDEYMTKLAVSRSDYDMVVIVTQMAQQAIRLGFIEPLDLDKLPNFKQLYATFQNLKYYKHDGGTYGVPTYWGFIPLTFNSDVIPDRNDFDVLFDPQFKGKITMWDDISTLAQVARWMGFQNVWDLSDDELEKVKAKMIEQKPLVRKYWSQAGEAIELFASGEVVAAVSWDYVTQELIKKGFHVRQPKYKQAMGWSDSHTIIKGTSKRELAHAFINHMISPVAQARMAEINAYRVTNPGAKPFTDPTLWSQMSMDENAELLPTTEFWDEVPRRAKYLEVWNEIKAAPVE